MHCCCNFPEGLESVTSDPLLLMAVPKICNECGKGGVSEEAGTILPRRKCGRCQPTLPQLV